MFQITTEQINQAVEALEAGKIIVYPTETSYALGCDATNDAAVRRIFDIKGRPGAKGLPVIISDKKTVTKYLEFSKTAWDIANLFWPGPLNIIGPISFGSPIASSCSQHGTQSIRATSHPFAVTLAARFGKPIVATSANISGQDSIYTINEVNQLFTGRLVPDLIIDAGELPPVGSSTTIKILGEQVTVIRQGSISIPEKFL